MNGCALPVPNCALTVAETEDPSPSGVRPATEVALSVLQLATAAASTTAPAAALNPIFPRAIMNESSFDCRSSCVSANDASVVGHQPHARTQTNWNAAAGSPRH